jgi:hypothetical protein
MPEAHQSLEEGASRRVRAALMQKVNGDEEMFALGGSIARVIELVDADEPGPHDLAYFVLSDVALTQRILRLSNTADRAQTAPEGVPPDETAMIRALKRQVLAALAAG